MNKQEVEILDRILNSISTNCEAAADEKFFFFFMMLLLFG